jgi:Kef-type K+ transport system membrane component KefB
MHDYWTLPIRNPVFLFGILLLTVLVAPALFQRLRMPGLVGLILTGALLGPHGINLLEHGEGIKLLAHGGLLYIMFWAGLEMDMVSFLKNKHKSLAFGMFTFLLPLSLGGICAFYFLGFSWKGALLLAGMFSTHTLISYPIVNRFRLAHNEAVAITVGGTIITDTLALLLLAVISGMEEGTVDGWFWIKLVLSLAVFGAIVFGILPKIARWFFRKVESDLTYQYVFVLAAVFGCGLMAELAGVEAIIGAFMAGLVLNRLIPHTSPLMDRIGFVGNALFIPAFLFSVGMMVNLQVFYQGKNTILTALLLTGIALFTKWVAAWATQQVFNYTPSQRNLVFGLSSSHAAATIAIILIGFKINLFDEQVLNATVFLILVTCLVSTFVTDGVARKMAASGTVDLPVQHGSPQRILVPFANPSSVTHLVDFAILLKIPGQNEPVYPLSIILDEKNAREKILQSQRLTEPLMRHALERKTTLVPVHRVDVSAVSGILRATQELLATEIVIGWRPRMSATEKLFGTLHDNLLEEITELVFVTHFTCSPFAFHRVKIFITDHAHVEPGFPHVIKRLENVCLQLSAFPRLLASAAVAEAAGRLLSKKAKERFQALEPGEDAWQHLHENLGKDELLFILSTRRKGVSHEPFMDKIPAYLAEHFEKKSFVLVFPGL